MDITIVIPVYNRKGLVQKTLDTIPDTFNIIIVDNGSTDGSYEFCRQWMLNSRRKNVRMEREFAKGACAARNKGLALCKTEWVYFFDSDDEFTGLPEQWPEQYDMICIPTVQVVDGKAAVRAYFPVQSVHTQILSSMLNTISAIYKTEWLRSIGGWNNDCKVWNDWELGIRMLLAGPRMAYMTNDRVTVNHSGEASITGNSFSAKAGQWENVMNVVEEELVTSNHPEKLRLGRLLEFKRIILAAQYEREGNHELSVSLCNGALNRLRDSYGNSVKWKLVVAPVVKMLFARIVAGKRGAAIVARKLL